MCGLTSETGKTPEGQVIRSRRQGFIETSVVEEESPSQDYSCEERKVNAFRLPQEAVSERTG